jgi:hypothetical protein
MKARRIVSFAALAMALTAGALALSQAACRTAAVDEAPSALFLGVSTDLVVDDDFDSIGLFVSVRGEVKLARVEEVLPNGTVGLPGTLSITQPADPSTPVHIRVAGYKKGQVIAVRDAISTVPTGRISLLRLPVQWLSSGARVTGKQRDDTGVTPTGAGVELRADPLGAASNFPEFARYFENLVVPCAAGETLVNGACIPIEVPAEQLVASTGNEHVAQVFGGAIGIDEKGKPQGGTCFAVEDCFAGSQEIPIADLGPDCSVPKANIDVNQINFGIRRKTKGDTKFVVPLDYAADPSRASSVGWYERDGRYHLPKAICSADAGRRGDITGVVVTTTCKAKHLAVPTCGAWSAVTEKQPMPPAAGPYFSSGDAGTDGPSIERWARRQFRKTDIARPSAMAIGTNHVWVVGDGGKGFGVPRKNAIDSLVDISVPALPFDAGAYPTNERASVAASNDVVVVAYPAPGNVVKFTRFQQGAAGVPSFTNTAPTPRAVVTMAPNDVGILLYHDVDFAVLRYKRVGAGSVDTGTINAFGANSQAPLAGLLDAKGQLYFTAGIRLYRAPSFVPDPMFTPVDTPFDPPAGIHVQRGEDLPLGIYVSGDTVFWEKEAADDTVSILRTDTVKRTTEVWISGIPRGEMSDHIVPSLVSDGRYLIFADGSRVYAKSLAGSPGSVREAIVLSIFPAESNVFALAYAENELFAASADGQLYRGALVLP